MNLKRVLLATVAVLLFMSAIPQSLQQGDSRKFTFGGTGAFEVAEAGENNVRLTYSMAELSVSAIGTGQGSFFSVEIPGHHGFSDPGKPELPVISRLLQVPAYSSYSVKYSNIRSISIKPQARGFEGVMFPSQPGRTKSQEREREQLVFDRETYRRNAFSRSDTIIITYTGNFRGTDLATINFMPVRYNPGRNLLEVIISADITISFNPSVKSDGPGSPETGELTGPPAIKSYSPDHLITGYTDKPAGLIILSDTAYRKQLEPLIKWKTQKGFRVTAIYRGETLAGTTYAQLKDSIRKVWLSPEPGFPPPDYLLIVGDLTKIPKADGTNQLSDMYYGEFTGDGDFLPEMFIGRVPAKDTAEVRAFVSKLVRYEKQEFADSNRFYLNSLVTAGVDGGYYTYMNGQVNYASTYYLNAGNGLTGTAFLHPESGSREDSVKALINSGIGFMNYTGHGDVNRWVDPTFANTDVPALTNKNRYPFIVSNACLTGQFSASNNLAASLVLASEKGAVGFIGCTNDSYWAEDYFYAVGAGALALNPVYSSSELGFYDRLFHTHDELPSQWYYTMGQVNFAGLMAVSNSSTLRKKYYWETYSLLGDPSAIPVIGPQETILTNIPDTLPSGLSSLYLTAPPFVYAAVSDGSTLWDASFVSPSGYVTLELPEVKGDSCLLVITGQGKKPLIKTIYFGEPSGAWLNADLFSIDDVTGNDNGKADYGETFYMGLTLQNLGSQSSADASVKISSDSEWVTIITDSVYVGAINPGVSVTLDKAFSMRLGADIPDQGIVNILITISDSDTTRTIAHDIVVQSPKLSIVSLRFDDTEDGNGNLLPDRDEILWLVFSVRNLGSSAAAGEFIITPPPSGFSSLDNVTETGTIPAGETVEIRVAARVSPLAYPGTRITLESLLECGFYSNSRTFEIAIGRTRESFEYTNFELFPWINNGTVPWLITSASYYDGNMSAMSGSIPNNGVSSLQINLDMPEADTLRFWYRVSSEKDYDFFRFKVNGVEIFKDSGEKEWRERMEILPAGAQLLEWSYTKDPSVSSGLDRAWIDMIDFPESAFAIRDIELAGVVSPEPSETYDRESLSVKIKNMGSGTINGFNLAYSVNNDTPVSQYFTNSITFMDSVVVSFDTPIDMSRYGIYRITVYSFENDDDFMQNDTIRFVVENTLIKDDIRAYPNPFSHYLNLFIDSPGEEEVTISIDNIAGSRQYVARHLLSEGDNTLTLMLESLNPGTYIISITGSSINRKIRVVKL